MKPNYHLLLGDWVDTKLGIFKLYEIFYYLDSTYYAYTKKDKKLLIRREDDYGKFKTTITTLPRGI